MSDLTRIKHTKRSENPRCIAMVQSSLTGRRCKYEAEPDTDPPRCSQHLHTDERRGPNGYHMSRYYLKCLRPTLAAKLEEAVDSLGSLDALDLTEELALIRVAAGDAVEQYAKAQEISGDDAKSTELKMITGQMMISRLQDVAKMCEAAGSSAELKVRLQTAFASVMTSVITSIAHAAWEVFGDDYRVKDFEELIRTKLEARGHGVEGTEITPDRDVIEMDETIPDAPSEMLKCGPGERAQIEVPE